MTSELVVQGLRGTELAPVGQVWVCRACGRRSHTRYGFDEKGERKNIDPGWDESCTMHATLCYEEKGPDGSWRALGEVEVIAIEVTV